MYTYIIYTPNSGLEIAVSVPEREHSRFRGSSEGAKSSEGALREHQEHCGGTGAQHGKPKLKISYPALPAYIYFITIVDTVARLQPPAAWIQPD